MHLKILKKLRTVMTQMSDDKKYVYISINKDSQYTRTSGPNSLQYIRE